jgi:hypothetical protein
MAKPSKSIYLTINKKGEPLVSLLSKEFFNAKEYNDYIKTEEFKEKWPSDQYNIIKEVY